MKGKGLIRSLNRTGTRPRKARPIEATGRPPEPAACDRCGAIFSRRVWRQRPRVTGPLLERVHWTRCPACRQVGSAVGHGRVLVRGPYAALHEAAIRRRINNVAARAAFTQPERRVSTIERRRDALEILTTSQKLAHRIVRELKKAFGGRASYAWSDDGTLFATWQR
jgi:NMD protein affecting ribosome stability and mRNA decay